MGESPVNAVRRLHIFLCALICLAGGFVFAGCDQVPPAIRATSAPPTGTRATSALATGTGATSYPTATPPPAVGATVSKPGPLTPSVPSASKGNLSPRNSPPSVPWQTYIRAVTLTLGTRGDTFDPLGKTTTYLPTQHEFHCVVTVENAPNGTQLRAQWYYHKVEGLAENSLIDDAYATIGGTGNLDFTLFSRGDWPLGEYRVQIWAEDELAQVTVFAVRW